MPLFPNSLMDRIDDDTNRSRRALLRRATTVVTGAVLGNALGCSSPAPAEAVETSTTAQSDKLPAQNAATAPKLRGVNLGGWLLLEKWITPSVFRGIKAGDEYGLGAELGPKAARERLRAHRDSFITEKDFEWLAKTGLNAVRIPVGYWALEAEAPFVDAREPLDRAFAWAKRHKIRVILDLHGAPGSQNGFDHSGKSGPMEWHTKPENIARSLDVVEALAARYKNEPALFGLELLNEPRWDMPLEPLKRYYQEGYTRVRRHLPAERVAVVIHDAFRPMEWSGFMAEPQYSNVILDTHLYQCFTDEDKKRPAAKQIELASVGRSNHIEAMQRQLWTSVGEWSVALNPEVMKDLTPVAQDAVKRAYGGAQLLSFEQAVAGWFFWTYKTETAPEWSMRECVRRGWLPSQFV